MQNRPVRWLALALEDLQGIAAYLTEKDSDAGQQVAQCLWNAGQSLASLPSQGRTGRVVGTREFALTEIPYFIAYRVVKSEVQILSVLHTARRYPQ
ncbi:type II toxin-antitoxin system RelE/ParE family toxin [Desulfovibrio desulfuricans]|uniref:type II toxin-antitoxin system RelE/ParE family toxin n=1 Tax=Desulfovibrio desulfuricans TaxID=876 RepID=UPI00352EC186